MSSIFKYKGYELAFFLYESSIKIRLLDAKNARCFESIFSNEEAKNISKSLCLDSKDLYSLLTKAMNSPNEQLHLEILSLGTISLKIFLQFPIEKLIEFSLILDEMELNEYRKGLYHLQDLEARLTNIETLIKKEQMKIKKNTHFPLFESSPSLTQLVLAGVFSNTNKRKTITKLKKTASPESELLEGTKLEKISPNDIKFSIIFKGKTCLIEGYFGIAIEKDYGLNNKGCFVLANGAVYWDGTFFNINCCIRNEEEISLIICEEKESIRWEDKEGRKIFEGKYPFKKKIFKEIVPLVGLINEGDSATFL